MYKTEIKGIGKDAKAFEEEKMMVLFGDNAPAELADYCYIINIEEVEDEIKEKYELNLDNIAYKITSVRDAVRKYLNDIRHITLKYDGSKTAGQAGTLYL